MILDVDHFKQINDTYGHPAGDAVLREIGIAVAGSTKAFDVAARYGGDEFVVLLPGCTAVDAHGVARPRACGGRAPGQRCAGHSERRCGDHARQRRSTRNDSWLRPTPPSTRRSAPAATAIHASARTAEGIPNEGRVQWRAPLARGA